MIVNRLLSPLSNLVCINVSLCCWIDLKRRAKGGRHTLPPYTVGRSFAMIVSDLVTVYTSCEVGI
jgi:hypothetical protein